MMWDVQKKAPEAVQQSLFPKLNDEEALIVRVLEEHDVDGAGLNTLVMQKFALLLQLAMHRLNHRG
jgi:hypothetical protein